MNAKTAVKYQRVEDALTASLAQCEAAIAALARLESDGLEAGASDPDRVDAIVHLLKARRRLRRASEALADKLFDASCALVPEAVDTDF